MHCVLFLFILSFEDLFFTKMAASPNEVVELSHCISNWKERYLTQLREIASGAALSSLVETDYEESLPQHIRVYWPIIPFEKNPVVQSAVELCLRTTPRVQQVSFGVAFASGTLLTEISSPKAMQFVSEDAAGSLFSSLSGITKARQRIFRSQVWSAVLLRVMAEQSSAADEFLGTIFQNTLLGLPFKINESSPSSGNRANSMDEFLTSNLTISDGAADRGEHFLVRLQSNVAFDATLHLLKVMHSTAPKNIRLNLLFSRLEESLVELYNKHSPTGNKIPIVQLKRLLTVKTHLLPSLRLPTLQRVVEEDLQKSLRKLRRLHPQESRHAHRTPHFYESELQSCVLALGQHTLDHDSILLLSPLFLKHRVKAHIARSFLQGALFEAIHARASRMTTTEAKWLGSMLLYHACQGGSSLRETAYVCLRDLACLISSRDSTLEDGAALDTSTSSHLFHFLGPRLFKTPEGVALLTRSLADGSVDGRMLSSVTQALTAKEWRALIWDAIYEGKGRSLHFLQKFYRSTACPQDVIPLLESEDGDFVSNWVNEIKERLFDEDVELSRGVESAHSILLGCVHSVSFASAALGTLFTVQNSDLMKTYLSNLSDFMLNGIRQCRSAGIVQIFLDLVFASIFRTTLQKQITWTRFLTNIIINSECATEQCVAAIGTLMSEQALSSEVCSSLDVYQCVLQLLSTPSVGPHVQLFHALRGSTQDADMRPLLGLAFTYCVPRMGMDYLSVYADKIFEGLSLPTITRVSKAQDTLNSLGSYGMDPNAMGTFFVWFEKHLAKINERESTASNAWIVSIRDASNAWAQCCIAASIYRPNLRTSLVQLMRRELTEAHSHIDQKPDAYACMAYVTCQIFIQLFLFVRRSQPARLDLPLQEDIQEILYILHNHQGSLEQLPAPHSARSALLSRGTLSILESLIDTDDTVDVADSVSSASIIATEILANVERGTHSDYWMVEHYGSMAERIKSKQYSIETEKETDASLSGEKRSLSTNAQELFQFDPRATRVFPSPRDTQEMEEMDVLSRILQEQDLDLRDNSSEDESQGGAMESSTIESALDTATFSHSSSIGSERSHSAHLGSTTEAATSEQNRSKSVSPEIVSTLPPQPYPPGPALDPSWPTTAPNSHGSTSHLRPSSSSSAGSSPVIPALTQPPSHRTPSPALSPSPASRASSLRHLLLRHVRYQNAATILKEIAEETPWRGSEFHTIQHNPRNRIEEEMTMTRPPTRSCSNTEETNSVSSPGLVQHPFTPTLEVLRSRNALKPYMVLLQKATARQDMSSAVKDLIPALRRLRTAARSEDLTPATPRKGREPHPGELATQSPQSAYDGKDYGGGRFSRRDCGRVENSPRSRSTTRVRFHSPSPVKGSWVAAELASRRPVSRIRSTSLMRGPGSNDVIRQACAVQHVDTTLRELSPSGKMVSSVAREVDSKGLSHPYSVLAQSGRHRSVSSPPRVRHRSAQEMREAQDQLEGEEVAMNAPLTQPSPSRLPRMVPKEPHELLGPTAFPARPPVLQGSGPKSVLPGGTRETFPNPVRQMRFSDVL